MSAFRETPHGRLLTFLGDLSDMGFPQAQLDALTIWDGFQNPTPAQCGGLTRLLLSCSPALDIDPALYALAEILEEG